MFKWLLNTFGMLRQLQVDNHDGAGNLVARVGKTLYVRLKPQARQA